MNGPGLCAHDAGWLAAIGRDLGVPADRIPAVAWSLHLRSQSLEPGLPETAVVKYRSLDWSAPLPVDEPIDVRRATRRASHGEVIVEATARVGTAEVARSLTVFVVPGTERDGVSVVPARPVAELREQVCSFVVNDVLAEDFARLGGGHYALSEDAGFARRHGYPDALLQEGLALALLAGCHPMPPAGRASVWYGAPLPVGSLVALWSADATSSGSVWTFRLAGRPVDAATIVLEELT